MSLNDKPVPPTPAKGQQSLYPNPNSLHPPSYEESMSPQGRAICFQPPAAVPASPVPSSVQVPIVQHVYTSQPAAGPHPTMLICSSCQKSILTKIEYKTSTKTHIMAGLLCCCIFPFAWVPYAVDTCKNANHYCPNCGAYIGQYKH